MRVFRFLRRSVSTAGKDIDYYSKFSPSPLSMKQFLDFGKWMLLNACVGLRVCAPTVAVEAVSLSDVSLSFRSGLHCGQFNDTKQLRFRCLRVDTRRECNHFVACYICSSSDTNTSKFCSVYYLSLSLLKCTHIYQLRLYFQPLHALHSSKSHCFYCAALVNKNLLLNACRCR